MLSAEYQELLQVNILFADFTQSEFAQVCTKTTFCELKDQQHLFEQGQAAEDFFLLVNGKIKLAFLSLEGNEKVVDVINPGHSFGEAVMFFGKQKYPLNASALEKSGVLRINAENYLSVLKTSPKSCFRVMGKLSQRLHWATAEINNLSLHDSKYRLIKFLLNNTSKKTSKLANVQLLIPKHILASQLSIKPETLSRMFKDLSEQGLIEVHNNHISLLKPLELKSIISP